MTAHASQHLAGAPRGGVHRGRVIIFRALAALAGAFFVVAVVIMASAP
jgi:hypothetical protein